jgi:5-methylcytosine-specific restriction protein B
MSYFEELTKFLAQAETSDLKTSHYLKNYSGLEVRVSFGQGNQSKIPWIAFLNETDSVQQGIYPVYLYYKEIKLLILAYGVSETHTPNRNWNLPNVNTVEQYFAENGLGKPERYGSSYVFKAYDIKNRLDKQIIDTNLSDIIGAYKKTDGQNVKPKNLDLYRYLNFQRSALNGGLFFSEKLSLRFTASLLTKPFVILTGLSGSGKTKLAQAFAMWLCEHESQYCIVPVGADWTNREPLLGFPNALIADDYKTDEYGVLKLILEAGNNAEKPYFLILDEMNLSHVERYFADFLSVMESKGELSLHSGNQEWNGIPSTIGFPQNLFIVGTVNIDETTYMFSPKVLDRANVIEFRVNATEMSSYLKSSPTVDLYTLKGIGASMGQSFVEIAKDRSLAPGDTTVLNDTLMGFFSELKKTGAEFGYRSASEILRFAAVVNKLDPSWKTSDIIDAAIMQKLLPKVHGSRRKLEPVLKTLGTLCLSGGQKIEDYLSATSEIDFSDGNKVRYPVSLEKILRMHDNLISNGFTSYAEA